MKNNFPFLSVLFFLLTGLLPGALAQQYHFRNFGLREGLAQSQVYAMLEDSYGQIWMGTRGGGLSCFDGIRFRNFGTREGLADNYVLSLAQDKAGIIWIGTNSGLASYDGQNFQFYTVNNGGITVVEALLALPNGDLLLGTNKGIFIRRAAAGKGKRVNFERFGPSNPLLQSNISSLCRDQLGRIWAGNNNGLFRLDPFLHLNTRSGLKSSLVRCITVDAQNRIWAGTYGGGIFSVDHGRLQVYSSKELLKDRIIHCIYTDKSGNIWFGTQDAGVGYRSARDSLFRFLQDADGLGNNHIRSLLQDRWGGMWFGTSGAGVSKYYGQDFFHFDRTSGLNGKNVYALCGGPDNSLLIGTSAGGLTRMSELGRFEAFEPRLNTKVKKVFRDMEGRTWAGTDGEGLFLFQDSTYRHFSTDNGLKGNWIRDILQDLAGNIWIAKAGGGITRMQEQNGQWEFKHYGLEDGLSEDRINSLCLDKNGWIWFATANSGIGYITPDTVACFTQRSGLPSNKIRSLLPDPSGFIWAGTADAGVFRFFPGPRTISLKRITVRNGLSSGNIYQLTMDREGNLWLGSESGLDELLLSPERNVMEIRHFGLSEGFLGVETSQNAGICDSLGNLWFGTINGLTGYFPINSSRDTLAPGILWRNISLFFEPLTKTPYAGWLGNWGMPNGLLSLPYDQNHLSFEFAGVNHRNPERVRYQWKLEGLENNWSPVSDRNQVTYSNLSPGKYRFLVRACNQDGVWSAPLSAEIEITPPFWKRWWFFLLIGLAVLLLFWSITRLRIRQLKRKQEKLKLENELLQLEQKALQLQMNPHFIFHALHTIQGQIGNRDEQSARLFLGKFSKLMRQILESSREARIPLSTEMSILDNYLALEQMNQAGKFDYIVEARGDMETDLIQIPPMMLQPLVENAIQHGILPMQGKGMIRVSFREEGSWLVCEVSDNGIGPEQSAQYREPGHKSTAMQVLRERLQHMEKGNHSLDLELVALPEGGTRVVLKVPL